VQQYCFFAAAFIAADFWGAAFTAAAFSAIIKMFYFGKTQKSDKLILILIFFYFRNSLGDLQQNDKC
jgi:hypothetical protein